MNIEEYDTPTDPYAPRCRDSARDEGASRMIRHPAGARHWTRRKPELIRRGVDSHAAKLSADDIATLYRFADVGWQPSELAGHFCVSRVTIWRHLKSRSLHT